MRKNPQGGKIAIESASVKTAEDLLTIPSGNRIVIFYNVIHPSHRLVETPSSWATGKQLWLEEAQPGSELLSVRPKVALQSVCSRAMTAWAGRSSFRAMAAVI